MKLIVCVKQVPDTTDIKWTENNTIQREGVESITNPFDVYAIEEALKIKKTCKDVEITVITMGPLQAEDMLKKAIAVGCDNGVLISDRKFAGADTYATGKTIASAIKNKISDFDLIICGQFAIDGDTAQTGPSIANQLDIPQATFVKNVVECDENCITVTREIEEERRLLYVGMTRAKERLFLSHALKRKWLGTYKNLQISPFLEKIKDDLLKLSKFEKVYEEKDNSEQLSLF